eukprot:CAMPEP_0173072790 /NCGR_PEP_ID=MMETSP1102-20130122/10022_1 /TAXON_ID=49646 /ORGANISM="Geminigera sp., Strain Caron Lab Isolate" /LENGTH=197 /DNA_ID=CAMNT_0013941517 /DNA_START=55 /DNA_END=644 /DNA_ORIENTATION=-
MPKKKGKGKTAQVAAPIQVKRLPPKPCGTSRSIASLSHHSMAVTALEVSIEGKCFFSASLDGTVAMIDTSSTTVLHHFKSVDAEVLCLAKVGPSLISGTEHGLVYQMDVRTCAFDRILNSQQERVLSLSAGTHPHEIITGGQDGSVLVWDLRTGKKLIQHAVHDSAICSVHAVGSRIFSGSWDQSILVMDEEHKTRS